jgi:hypothetical protein
MSVERYFPDREIEIHDEATVFSEIGNESGAIEKLVVFIYDDNAISAAHD